MQMQARGFFGSLFDYSFSSYITPRIIKVLYVVATVLVALWTLLFVLLAFRASSTLGILVLLIGGPIYFVLMMIWARVLLEFFLPSRGGGQVRGAHRLRLPGLPRSL